MKKSIVSIILFSLIFIGFAFKHKQKAIDSSDFEPITVLELFTSQGCSSCPPADKLLVKTILQATAQNKKIYALSFHVDYWNRLGWTDPFSSKQFTARQQDYVNTFNLNGAYTPQMVVNGTYEFTGSDKTALDKYIAATQNTKAETKFITLEATMLSTNKIEVKYTLEGNIALNNINIALVSTKEITSIKTGENEGATLVNENIVRSFSTKKAMQNDSIIIDLKNTILPSKMNIIAYVQNGNSKIVGAAIANIETL